MCSRYDGGKEDTMCCVGPSSPPDSCQAISDRGEVNVGIKTRTKKLDRFKIRE